MTPLLKKVLSRLAAKRLLDGIPAMETSCPPLVELAAYLDGRLRGRERREVEGHLAGCAGCRAGIIELRHILGALAIETAGAPEEVLQAARNIFKDQCARQACAR
ncbi:Putative zinc-finger [Desulfocurvibacter africanus PCS]|uniref:Putative zinc-finger n=1 Tax=Desulfocurvibacter africanus PCS TaxID=1262666 RepID=M5PPW9_DESAF|nr:zf-HC2 domain-containing protein [Desulfocurvibacter africanus]EMG36357.1 Putative zinc-finger [Desulfocurvibacter africanus PCS]